MNRVGCMNTLYVTAGGRHMQSINEYILKIQQKLTKIGANFVWKSPAPHRTAQHVTLDSQWHCVLVCKISSSEHVLSNSMYVYSSCQFRFATAEEEPGAFSGLSIILRVSTVQETSKCTHKYGRQLRGQHCPWHIYTHVSSTHSTQYASYTDSCLQYQYYVYA